MMKEIVKKRIILVALTASMLLSLAACGSTDTVSDSNTGDAQSTSSGDSEYKYGSIEIPALDGALCGAPIYVAYEKGYFAEEGFDVTLISADFETRKIGLNNGSIPLVNGDFQFFPSIEEGVEATVVEGLHKGCIRIVVDADSDIDSVEDLRGATIGVDEIGGTPYMVASLWLETNGIVASNNEEVTFTPYSDGNLELQALSNGEIDAAALWDPFGSLAVEEYGYKEIFDLADNEQFADKYCCFLYASNKILEENPDEIAALLRAIHKAQNFIYENPEEAVSIIVEGNYSDISDYEDLAVELVKSYGYPSYDQLDASVVEENVKYFAEQLSNIGYLSTDDPDSFAESIYKYIETGDE